MSVKHIQTKEFIRIKKDKIAVRVVVIFGKQGDCFVGFAPSIFISGYGETEQEARASFDHNLKLFCSDLQALPIYKRENELRKLGFSKEEYRSKNFSRPFINDRDVLQEFNPGIITTSFVNAFV